MDEIDLPLRKFEVTQREFKKLKMATPTQSFLLFIVVALRLIVVWQHPPKAGSA